MKRLRILVADDDRDTVVTLAALLRHEGHEVREVYRASEVLRRVREFAPDVALLDIGMPRLNGYDACRAIRELPGGAQMVLIAISGWGEDGARRRTQEAGFDAHMVKPVNYEDVLKLVNELCRSKPGLDLMGNRLGTRQ